MAKLHLSKNLVASLLVTGLVAIIATFAATAKAAPQGSLSPNSALSPAASTAGPLHPCRNRSSNPLTTATLRDAMRRQPQCARAWATVTRGQPNPDHYEVRPLPRSQWPREGSLTVNSGIDNAGYPHPYKYRVQPGDTFVQVVNIATAVAQVAKQNCANPFSITTRPEVIRDLPPMPALVAWGTSTSTSSAKVTVDCGNGTKVTVDASAFAKALARARSRGGAAVITGTNTKTGVTVTIKCGQPKVAKPKQKVGTLVLEKRTDVPTGDRFTLCAQLVNKGPARCWTLGSGESVTAAQYKTGTVLYTFEDRVPQGWIVPFRKKVTIKPGINRVVFLNRKKAPPVKTYTATISKRVLDTTGSPTSEFASRHMPVTFTIPDRARWTMQIPMNGTTYGVSIDGTTVTSFNEGMVITACLDEATDRLLNLRVVGPSCITKTAGSEELRFEFTDQKVIPPPPPPGCTVNCQPPPPEDKCKTSPRPKECDPPPPATPNTPTQPVPGPDPTNSGTTGTGTTANSPNTRPSDGGTTGGNPSDCPRGMTLTADKKGCE